MTSFLRTPRRRVLLTLAAASWLAFACLAAVAAQDRLLAGDHALRALVRVGQHPVLEDVMAVASRLGTGEALIPLILGGSLLLWPRRRRWALALPAVMAGAGGLQFLAKWLIDRPRPDLTPSGFPSGHVLSLVVLLGVAAYLACTATARRRWRCLAIAACLLPVVLVGSSRLYLDVHWLTDVLGGFVAGTGYLALAIVAVESIAAPRSARSRGPASAPGLSD